MKKTCLQRYQSVYNRHAEFLRQHPIFLKCLLFANKALTLLFALGFFAVVCFTAISQIRAKAFDYLAWIAVVGAPICCLIVVGALRLVFPRRRPYNPKGANVTPFLEKKMDEKSFPSRHLASAFIIATLVCALCPILGVVAYLGGLFLGYIRFALGLHYPTDLLGGGVIGVLCGLCAFFIF